MTTVQPATPTAVAVAAAGALEGDVHQPTAHDYTYGTDLDWVLDQLDTIDPIDVESEDPTDEDWAVSRSLFFVRAKIIKRKAVQAGPRPDVDYCGLSHDKWGRACGPDLGLPPCAYHSRVATIDAQAAAELRAADTAIERFLDR